MGIEVTAYTKSIGDIEIDPNIKDYDVRLTTPTAMPDIEADKKAKEVFDGINDVHQLLIVSQLELVDGNEFDCKVLAATGETCSRCWMIVPSIDENELCPRCRKIVDSK